jgi:site-specific recombinase XerD
MTVIMYLVTIAIPEPGWAPAIPPTDTLTGPPPAREPYELAALMRASGLSESALNATAGWLSGEKRQSLHTQDGYVADLSRWVTWCAVRGIDPAAAPGEKADLFAKAMRDAGLANATRARRLSAASSWCGYLLRLGAAAANPFDRMDRPTLPKLSPTKGMSEDELERFLAYAKERESARTYALLSTMAATACRVCSVKGAQLGGLGEDRGHRIIDMPVKGGQLKRFVLPAVTLEAIGAWRTERGEEPGHLFLTVSGKPLDQPAVFRTVRRVAGKAGIPQAGQLSPHSIRHTVLTILHDQGYPTHIIQDLAGHADSRTTRRYDLARESLDRSPANELGAILAKGIARHAASFRPLAP